MGRLLLEGISYLVEMTHLGRTKSYRISKEIVWQGWCGFFSIFDDTLSTTVMSYTLNSSNLILFCFHVFLLADFLRRFSIFPNCIEWKHLSVQLSCFCKISVSLRFSKLFSYSVLTKF